MTAVERLAQTCWRDGIPGYYVVTRDTRIPVAGPYPQHLPAQEEATRRNTAPSATPGLLEVRQLTRGDL